DLRKPFDKASKDYDAKYSKLEKEKKQQAKESGLTRTEIVPQEIADEMEKERRYFQLHMCEYLIKVSEVKIKKGVDLAQHFVDYYHAQNTYFVECSESVDCIRSYTETLVGELKQLRIQQENEKKNLMMLRDEVKETLQIDREKSLERAGYTLHGQQGDINHGTMIKGYLLKRSEGVRKVWQKRYCVVNNGQLTLAYSASSAPNHTLNLLTCQVKGSVEKEGKKSPIFILVTHNRNYLFQAEDHAEMERWMSVLSNSRKEALEKAFGEHGNGLQKDNSTDEANDLRQRIVRVVQSLPGNDICADCNTPEPTWLSTNLGVLTCIECSGIHREMGVHVSRVRSLTLDNLGTAELLIAKAIGNGGFNEIMEATLDDDFVNRSQAVKCKEERKEFIRAKYINHQYAQKLEESPSALSKGLAKAVHKKDILAVLQVFAEGVDLSAPLHDQLHEPAPALGTVLVICPLDSIVKNQLMEAESYGLKAVSLSSSEMFEQINGAPDVVFASAEAVSQKAFRESLKRTRNIHAIVIDKSHTVETWTGRKNKKDKVFRSAYGELSILRSFCKKEGCYCVASLKPFVPNVVTVEPLQDCCSNCCLNCKSSDSCSGSNLPFEKDLVSDQEAPQPLRKRDTSDQQRNDICDALMELKDKFKHHCPPEVHGFLEELVLELVNNCSTIFTVSDILKFPVFSVRTALQILEVFQNIIDDTEEEDNTSEIFSTPDIHVCEGLNFDFTDMGNEICAAECLGDEEIENLF
ncbi:Arf-GAP with SH3 domain, ANK repeat and PH domain-containing 1, partial [Paramuricea clavata]